MTLDEWRLGDHQKRRIVATLPALSDAIVARVLKQVQTAARKYLRDYDANESRLKDISVFQRRDGKHMLKVERRHYCKRGRVPRVAMRAFITQLVRIYERATGKRIGRRINPYLDRRQEKPHPFLVAGLKTVGKRYAPRIVQQALAQLHSLNINPRGN